MFGACRVRGGAWGGRAAIWVAIVATVGLVLGACGGAEEEETAAPAAEARVFTEEDLEAILVEHPPVAPGMVVYEQKTLGVLGVFSNAVARAAAESDFGLVDVHEALSVDPGSRDRWVECTGVLFEDEQLAAEGFDLFLAALRAGGGRVGRVQPPPGEWTKLPPNQRGEKAAEAMGGEMVLVAPATELGDGVVLTGDMWGEPSTAYLWRVGNIVLLAASPARLAYEAREDALHMSESL